MLLPDNKEEKLEEKQIGREWGTNIKRSVSDMWHVKFEIPITHPSENIKEEAGCLHPEPESKVRTGEIDKI